MELNLDIKALERAYRDCTEDAKFAVYELSIWCIDAQKCLDLEEPHTHAGLLMDQVSRILDRVQRLRGDVYHARKLQPEVPNPEPQIPDFDDLLIQPIAPAAEFMGFQEDPADDDAEDNDEDIREYYMLHTPSATDSGYGGEGPDAPEDNEPEEEVDMNWNF